MNPVEKAIAEAKYTIPPPILLRAFAPVQTLGRINGLSVDSIIRDKVIYDRVMVDCNLVGGTQLDVPLTGIQPQHVRLPAGGAYNFALVFEIPPELTQQRMITKVLWINNSVSPVYGAYSFAGYNGSALTKSAMGVMQSQAPIPNQSTARVDLINPRTILVYDTNLWVYDAVARIMVENDHDMSTLPPTSYHHFSKLCELAIKAYIYNTLVMQINTAEIDGGQELAKFKEIVDSYADANELYQNYRSNEWKEVAAYSDPITARDFARMPFGAGI